MERWEKLRARIEEIESIKQAAGVLQWDQHTFMPPGGAASRGRQLATLEALVHERITAPSLAAQLSALESAPDGLDTIQRAALKNIRREVDQATKLPAALVKALAVASAAAVGAWQQAKAADDFAPFQPHLEALVDLKRQAAGHLGEAAHPYDNLLNQYDPGATVAELQPMFDRLAAGLRPLVAEAAAQPQPEPITDTVPLEGLKVLNRRIVAALGFRDSDGRLDESAHPFTLGVVPSDVRLTTHYHTDNLLGTLFGTIHETGHGLYEQGLPSRPGTLTDGAAGTGMHESQSRFWENVIGRSRPFAGWLAEQLAVDIPSLKMDADRLFGALNRVAPSLVRIHADELTYNLHIIVRFNLEVALVEGSLQVKDLPGAWADQYEQIVGVRPASPAQGVLQDVHWAMGLLGYFPSYTIGNLYAASLRYAMQDALPGMWDQVRRGDFDAVRGWLRENIHSAGSVVDAPELLARVVGDRDPVTDLITHLSERRAAAARLL